MQRKTEYYTFRVAESISPKEQANIPVQYLDGTWFPDSIPAIPSDIIEWKGTRYRAIPLNEYVTRKSDGAEAKVYMIVRADDIVDW